MAENQPTSPDHPPGPMRIFTRKVLIAVSISVAAVLLVMFTYQITRVLVLVFAAALLAVLITSASSLVHKYTHLPRSLAMAAVLLGSLALLALIIWFMQATTQREIANFSSEFGPALESFKTNLQHYMPQWFTDQMSNVAGFLQDTFNIDYLAKQAGGIAISTFGVLGSILVVIVVAIYFASSPDTYVKGFTLLFPPHSRTRVREVLATIGKTLQWWFVGQFISMVEVFVLTLIGLKIIGLTSTFALALLAGLFNIIPNFGPLLAAIPAVVLAAAPHGGNVDFDFKRVTYVVILYSIVQAIDAYVVYPYIQKRAIALPAALIMLSQITAFVLLGPLGLVLATPILAAVMVLVKMVYIENVLGDHSHDIDPTRGTR